MNKDSFCERNTIKWIPTEHDLSADKIRDDILSQQTKLSASQKADDLDWHIKQIIQEPVKMRQNVALKGKRKFI